MQPLLSRQEGSTRVPPPHRAYKTKWQVRTPRWPLPRREGSSKSRCTVFSYLASALSRLYLDVERVATRSTDPVSFFWSYLGGAGDVFILTGSRWGTLRALGAGQAIGPLPCGFPCL